MIMGFWISERDQDAAKALFRSLPPVYRQGAVGYTDGLASYVGSLPTTRHKIAKRKSGKTNHIERFNLTLRPRVAPLVRKPLSLAKKIQNLRDTVLNFIKDYNQPITLPV
ncbi:transposase, IS1 family [Thioploca ingrica]|uniref:Transposase, IS1 family n=1 Tax=Thioploca ingrica TaxID=40754 RepID=A0A090AHF2_9GAMM|nr:transposase, IS1 family [Thioploca ingrica]